MKAEIYIKGTFDRDTQIGCAAYYLETDSFTADHVSTYHDRDKGRGTYQMELTALINAMPELPARVTSLTVKTNNKAVAAWLSHIDDRNCCDNFYMPYIEVVRRRMNRLACRALKAEWITKTDNSKGNTHVNKAAHDRLSRELAKHYEEI